MDKLMSPDVGEKRHVLRAIWQTQMHVEPQALDLSPPAVRRQFEHIWQPAERLMAALEVLPLGLLRAWQVSPRGHLVFTHRPSEYRPGPQPWRDAALESVCYLSLADLVQDRQAAFVTLFHLIDHLLGSQAAEDGLWFSDGGGMDRALQQAAGRFVEINALGYGHPTLGVNTARDYFAHTLWLYLDDPRRLNVLDPLVHRLYQHTLMAEAFWVKPS